MEQGRREVKPPPQQPPENQLPHQPPPPPQKCPRCDSVNTKFCYYNNYSLSQPRYFCKMCRRYWTHGGTLRNVPVGGGCRKAKRVKTSSSIGGDIARPQLPLPIPPPAGADHNSGGGFMSSLAAMSSFSQPHTLLGDSSSGFSLFQGFNLPPFASPQPPQSQPQMDFYHMANQSLVQPNRSLGIWNQTPININNNINNNNDHNNASNPNPSVGTSFNPNLFPDFPDYGPSSS